MKRHSVLALALLTLAVLAAPALALDRVTPGTDVWHTPANGRTFTSFDANPIPAGFFCPGSAPFTGKIGLRGAPIVGVPGSIDTVVSRLDEAGFNAKGVARTRVQVRAIHLVSIEPIQTSCGAYNVRVNLAPGQQPSSLMRIQQTGDDTGTFSTALALNVRMTFEPVGRVGATRRLDQSISLGRSAEVPWVAQEQGRTAQPEMMIDTNGDGRVDTRLAGSGGFYPGWRKAADVNGGGARVVTRLQALEDQIYSDEEIIAYHEAPTHAHEVTPPPPPDCGWQFICPIQDAQ